MKIEERKEPKTQPILPTLAVSAFHMEANWFGLFGFVERMHAIFFTRRRRLLIFWLNSCRNDEMLDEIGHEFGDVLDCGRGIRSSHMFSSVREQKLHRHSVTALEVIRYCVATVLLRCLVSPFTRRWHTLADSLFGQSQFE